MNLVENRRARFDYEILETYEAGIVLDGGEVKSLRNGNANITGSYIIIRPHGAELINCHIPPYQAKNTALEYKSDRTRRLLLNKKELEYLFGKAKEGGLTIVPLSIYTKGRRIKVSLGLGRHKKQHDKREVLKKRAVNKEIRRALKRSDE
ncbi:MAG: SsrA-binding protein SmpB [bacterium]|nr:SsrA-binding protein SmpB [bacterium]